MYIINQAGYKNKSDLLFL